VSKIVKIKKVNNDVSGVISHENELNISKIEKESSLNSSLSPTFIKAGPRNDRLKKQSATDVDPD
jgi:hypothetical protein